MSGHPGRQDRILWAESFTVQNSNLLPKSPLGSGGADFYESVAKLFRIGFGDIWADRGGLRRGPGD